jgi:hypothetical protein
VHPAEQVADVDLVRPLFMYPAREHRGVALETRNRGRCKLKTAGAWRYLADPATEIVVQSDRGCPRMGRCERLVALATDHSVRFVSFSDFEPIAWRTIMVGRYGFPPIPI